MVQPVAPAPALPPAAAAAASAAAALIANAGNNATGYHLVYTASTGCGGPTGNYRHDLENITQVGKTIPVDYINTNFWSNKPEMAGTVPPLDTTNKPVPGKEIAHVAMGGNNPEKTGSQLGLDLYEAYHLNALSKAAVLVYVTDARDRKKDRVVKRFEKTDLTDFPDQVRSAIATDQKAQTSPKQAVAR